jgi:hypothetical protein
MNSTKPVTSSRNPIVADVLDAARDASLSTSWPLGWLD